MSPFENHPPTPHISESECDDLGRVGATADRGLCGVIAVAHRGLRGLRDSRGLRGLIAVAVVTLAMSVTNEADAQNQQAYGRTWGGNNASVDWNRFYHYPYVYYPQNFWSQDYYRSSDSLYHRYPPEMRIPVYNRRWHNFYPSNRRYHSGHHFMLDVF